METFNLLKHFVPATNEDRSSERTSEAEELLLGQEISAFYENLVSEDVLDRKPSCESTSAPNVNDAKLQVRPLTCSAHHPCRPVSVNSFLKYAQCGDLSGLKTCLQQDIDVNCKDSYGWTALMCAASNGMKTSVRFLIDSGADQTVVDCRGLSALELACINGYAEIVKALCTCAASARQFRKLAIKEENVDCNACRSKYKISEERSHLASISHQLNSQKDGVAITPPVYEIPESNVGFQLMLRGGWDKNKGLGPNGDGTICPTKVILKRDRKGFGETSGKPKSGKVTWFGPNDLRAIRSEPILRKATFATGHCKQRWTKEKQQLMQKWNRQKEIDFRRAFNSLEA